MTNLNGVWVGDALDIHPVLGLLVLRIVNFLSRNDWWLEVLEEVTSVVALAVEADVVGVVGAKYTTLDTVQPVKAEGAY